MNELIRFLAGLPAERERAYELNITDYVARNNTPQMRVLLEGILTGTADNVTDQIAYNAFYCLNVMYRRAKDYIELKELFDTYTKRFSLRHITFDHLKALFEIESDSLYDYTDMLRITYKDAQLFNDNAGFVHLFADVFVTIYEKGGLDDKEKYLEEWYSRALEAVDTAIELDPDYAKYYATKARIILIKKAYFEAEACINRAISYEKSSRSDYALRISNYQYYKMMIQMQKRMDALEEKYAALTVARDKEHDDQEYNQMPIAYQGDDPYVFVSYSHKDSDRVYPIITALQNHGARIWYDEGIDLGDEFAEVLAPKIKDTNIFLLMITPNIMNAEWVRKELSYAISRGKKVVCVHVTDTILSPGVELTINPYTQIYKYEMTEHEFYRKILTTMRNNKTVNTPERI